MDGEPTPVGQLLIETPGANAEKNNTDLFIKRGRIGVLGRSTAAATLFNLQAFAPAGGAGHRTSLRGGGPLTTLALSTENPALWHLLWLNVVPVYDPLDHGQPEERVAETFPWLAPTRLSDKTGRATTLNDIHPAQCFWGMPRRIRLDFEENVERLACDVTGEIEDVIVRTYRTRPWGVNYSSVPHPLTPTYRVKETEPDWLPVHPQPGGIAYRHWLSFVAEGTTRKAAVAILEAERRLEIVSPLDRAAGRLRVFGYDMDNMKARGFVESEMPLLVAPEQMRVDLENLLRRLVDSAVETANILAGSVKTALEATGGESLNLLRESFFRDTEQAFFAAAKGGLAALETAKDGDDPVPQLARAWLDGFGREGGALKSAAVDAFDRAVPVDSLIATGDFKAIEKAVAGRSLLLAALAGYGSSGAKLFRALQLAPPEAKGKNSKSKRKAEVRA